jgi:DNA-binding CsgD family transcriptional regulator/tetratricopeptide (TPR) repeat protein
MADARMVDAVEYASRAGGFAERALAFEEAADHFDGAAALAHDPGTRDSLLLMAGHNRMLASQYELALATYRLVCNSTDPDKRARAAIGFAEATWRPGRLGHEAIAQLRRALDGGGADMDLRLHTELEAQLARAYGYAGSPGVARKIGESALRAARGIGDDALLAMALIAPGYASPAVEQPDLDRFIEAAALARRLDDVDLLAQATFAQASTSYALGQRDTWHQAVTELDTIAERTGQPFHRVALANAMASLAFLRGEYDQALGIVDGILEHAQVFVGRDRVDGLHGSASFLIRRETGLDKVRPLITGDPDSEVGDWPLGLLAIYTELGLRRSAAAVLDRLMDSSLPSTAAGRYEGAQAVYLTEAACALGHRPHAQTLYEVLSSRSGTNLISGFFVNVFGSADRYLGMLAGVLDIEARDHFDAALEMDTHMGATHHRAETLARYAEYLRDRDPDESALLAQEAHDLGRLMRSERIQRISRPQAPASESVLTRRETEVLELIARGCSNRDISEKLFISVNTAANHVRSILIKLDAENRTQAAHMAADRGLLDR